MRLVFFPASDGELIDTWTIGGMRGTGSHDYAIKELFIPAERTLAMDAPSRLDDPLYRFPLMALMDSMMAAVPLGIARAAIDAFIDIAGGRVAMARPRRRRNKPTVQADVGRAEAVLQAARAWLYESVERGMDRRAGRPHGRRPSSSR